MKSLLLVFIAVTALQGGQSRTVERHVATTPRQRVEVSGISGSRIVFRSWPKNEVYVRLSVSISSSDERYEQEYVASVGIDSVVTPDAVRLVFREGASLERSGSWFNRLFGRFFINKEISGEVYVPQSSALSTDMKYGTLSLEGMTGAVELLGVSNSVTLRNCTSVGRVENDYGTTRIENSGGALDLRSSSGKVTVTDFAGSVDIDADYSTVSVARATKDVSVTDQSGRVTLDDVDGGATVNANYSGVTMTRVKGAVRVRSASATVRLREVGSADVQSDYSTIDITGVSGTAGKRLGVKSQSGKLVIQDAVGDLDIDNPYSAMRFERIRGNVSVSTTSGSIDATDVAGDWRSQTEYTTVTLRQLAAGTITVTNSSNPVRMTLKSVPTNLSVTNKYGGVRISMPQGYTGEVDLDAQYGTIETNLPVRNRNRNGSATATGKIGTGSGSIMVETTSGNIDLEEQGGRAGGE